MRTFHDTAAVNPQQKGLNFCVRSIPLWVRWVEVGTHDDHKMREKKAKVVTCKQGPECGPGVTDSSQPGQSLSHLGASPAWIRQPHLQPQHQSKINKLIKTETTMFRLKPPPPFLQPLIEKHGVVTVPRWKKRVVCGAPHTRLGAFPSRYIPPLSFIQISGLPLGCPASPITSLIANCPINRPHMYSQLSAIGHHVVYMKNEVAAVRLFAATRRKVIQV